ncbi:protoporphyrinogen oxidase [Oceanisphaera profunda]|uniref:Protoporphyrinogen IX dehydrogenase [quinone] n=1 Tax=Oceanisphaera profunda TaxID=1416627 RepID=A0A1Y0D5T6_9GAMM|nr:menaquinone-dependent protoporphyrinogen IX dehydrogenase [Oceanisphaera profunda]ART82415.1 protoporphyrinogen oxidase [Oceanisphaera profunda]
MEKLLILYSSRNGQTKKIIDAMQGEFSGYEVELADLHGPLRKNLSKYDKVLIGASIRYGKFHPDLYHFINIHSEQLAAADASFFCVCLTARKPEKANPSNNAYVKQFLAQSRWRPRTIGVFAGALQYSQYTWWQTRIIQLIMKMTGGSTDTSQDIEFTDWNKVQEFAQRIAQDKY